jgi:hypothetical protein
LTARSGTCHSVDAKDAAPFPARPRMAFREVSSTHIIDVTSRNKGSTNDETGCPRPLRAIRWPHRT